MKQWISQSPEDTQRIGEELARQLKTGDVVAMFGGLGMGKTAFVRGMAKGLEIDGAEVSSPTYAIVHEYNNGKIPLYHFDMYRVSTWEDLDSAGFFYYLSLRGIIAVEWSENIEGALPKKQVIDVTLTQGNKENERIITISSAEDDI